ncbi:DUF4864 domain-containing protein [Noviherbaspirillum cavernae]|uniref:DUF4864 domain-containing protein n=1 Tax=Noviherbaspirillum cavernae TaxID=2320862 RepID=A0A418X2Z5_9BURK|nr:DUF4864 domain-containing protein [Noviherbaspirillum cavernae]RJG06837.1 DUF4864 domain-containing protein [Noviherbaspirillum cavernae]
MKIFLATTVLLFGLGLLPQHGNTEPIDEITTADAIAIHAAVQSQLEALAQDDATSAFEMTSLAKRMQIGTPDNFMRMIKNQYTPIYRAVGLIFSRPEMLHGDPIQVVRITDSNSHVWLAIFWMQQDEDSNWKIDGCQMFETDSISI